MDMAVSLPSVFLGCLQEHNAIEFHLPITLGMLHSMI